MSDKEKILADIQALHKNLMSELDKIIFKLDNYTRQKLEAHRSQENEAMDKILEKIKSQF
ncbi:MAG: hypothetical protein C3F02_01130 [Parcubacteria group bacterium]|nr:MAG: hypothetical protein C3F02_01130 [Parcubacteria group bacterium]